MAWVRYDDQFYANPKVTAVVAEDAGALALHVLANTWTNGQKRAGFVPAHQPGILVCDKGQGAEWARILADHGLWHHRDNLELCASCCEEYKDLPTDLKGYVFHNAAEYRAPERDRSKPGTPGDLSEKRREAGRKGGQAAAAKRREQEQRGTSANQGDSSSKSSNLPLAGASKADTLPLAGVSPDPVPEPVKPTPQPPAANPPTSATAEIEKPGEGESPDQDRTTNLTLVAEVRDLRPDWTTQAILKALSHPEVLERPQHLVPAAMLAVARDPDSKFPGRLSKNGPWWGAAPAAAPTPTPPAYKAPAVVERATDEGMASALGSLKGAAWYRRVTDKSPEAPNAAADQGSATA